MTPPPRTSGDRLGPYELVRPLGVGSTCEVWESVLHGPAGFRKPVALKLFRGGVPSPTFRDMLLREARTGALLQHPNIVATLHLSEVEGTWCLALELVHGLSVDALARHAGGRLPAAVVVEVGIQAAAALHHVHTFRAAGAPAGLVHRDVKPANLLVDRTGIVKLADLGISVPGGESAAVAAGTPGYLAPEQAAGRPEPASDLFSLGAVLYVLATGARPFGRGRAAIAAAARVEASLAEPGFLAPVEERAPGLAEVVRSCLRYAPADRVSSARELFDALSALRPHLPPGPTLLQLLAEASPEHARQVSPTPAIDTVSGSRPAGNLRVPRDAFVGRATELAAVEAIVRHDRWAVILGPGGVGKTRLAVETGRRLRSSFPGGVWVIELSSARTVADVCAAAAAALGVDLERRDPVAQLGRVFAARGRVLVIADNLERCARAVPETVGRWLDDAPAAVFLGTSRVIPGLAGERILALGELGPTDAAALLLARAPRPLAEPERPLVGPLVAALEHVPLAIELAAARMRVLDLASIRARLSLALLSGGGPETPERQRSLAASLRWSCELLSPTARAALAELSVFEGGFDLGCAEAVLDPAAAPDAPWAIDVLQELSDASLLRVDSAAGRFVLGEPVREFAAGLLSPEARTAAEARHGAHFAALGAREAMRALEGRGGVVQFRRLARDLANLVAACRRAAERGDGPVAVRTLAAAHAVLARRGPAELRSELSRRVASLTDLSPADRVGALSHLGTALFDAGRMDDALEVYAEVLALARGTGDRRAEGVLLGSRANVLQVLGRREEAESLQLEALRILRAVGERHVEGRVLLNLGLLQMIEGRTTDARRLLEQARAVYLETGNLQYQAFALATLGALDNRADRLVPARECYERAIALHREADDRFGEARVLGDLAALCLQLGQPERARELAERAHAMHRDVGNRHGEALADLVIGEYEHLHGRMDEARARFERAVASFGEIGDVGQEAVAVASLATLEATVRPESGREPLARTAAALRDRGDRRNESIARDALARLLVDLGDLEGARAEAEAALALARAVDGPRVEATAAVTLARIALADAGPLRSDRRLEDAERILRTTGHALELASLLAVRADLLARAGDRASAWTLLEEAGALVPWSARVRAEVAAVRARLEAEP